jgi:hypothetical protein
MLGLPPYVQPLEVGNVQARNRGLQPSVRLSVHKPRIDLMAVVKNISLAKPKHFFQLARR